MLRYRQQNHVRRLLSAAAAISLLWSCGGDDVTSPTEGTVQITTSTSGSDLDGDGYSVSFDGRTPQGIEIRDTLILPEIEPGDYSVILTGVAPNCATNFGINQRTATVVAGDTVRVAFAVTCETIDTGGGDPPPGGDPVI